MKSVLAFAIVISICTNLYSQVDTCWTRSYGGSASEAPGFGSGFLGSPEVKSAVDVNNNLWITCASTSNDGDVGLNNGLNDIWVIKLDPNGDTLFTKVIGGTQNETPYDIEISPSGGAVIAGYSASSDGDFSANSGLEDAFLLSLDASGNLEWINNYGGSQGDIFFAIEKYTNGYYLMGTTGSVNGDITDNQNSGSNEAWIAKSDFNGNLIWNRTTSGNTQDLDYNEHFWDGTIINDNFDIVVQGITGDFSDFNTDDILVVRYDSLGTKVWLSEFGSTSRDIANGIEFSSETNSVIGVGSISSATGDVTNYYGGMGDFWIHNIDLNGNLIGEKTLGGSQIDYPYSISTSPTNTLFVSGITNSTDGEMNATTFGGWDFWSAEIDPYDLDTLQALRLGGSANDYLHGINFRNDGKIYAIGRSRSNDIYVQSNQGETDVFAACINLQLSANLTNVDPFVNVEITPNPFEKTIHIFSDINLGGYELKICDTQGNIVYQTRISDGQFTFTIDQPLAPGLYTVIIFGEQKNFVRKLVKS